MTIGIHQTSSKKFIMNTLRHLFRSSPAVVIASALFAAINGPGETPPALGATLSPPASTTKAPDAGGFIQRWLLLEPIPANGQVTDKAVQATVKSNYFPNQLSVIPKDGDKVTVSDKEYAWHALDTRLYNVNLYHFGNMLKKPTSNAIFWGVTVVNSPTEMRNVRLAIGSNSASVWWVNGVEVTSIYGDRQTVVDDGVSRRLTLKKGPNVVRVALVNNAGACDFCARFLDSEGKPIKDLTVSLSDSGI
jgi:hypothetical protein